MIFFFFTKYAIIDNINIFIKKLKMKNLFLSILVFGFSINSIAQTTYWTSYNFSVDPENEETVYNLMDNHFKNNPIDGVTVYLYENHINRY